MEASSAPFDPSLQPTLAAALLAEREQRWEDGFSIAQEILKTSPRDPGALNLLGRLFGRKGDAAMAIALQCFALRQAPEHPEAARDLALARAAIASAELAKTVYDAALAIQPDVAVHHRPFGVLLPFVGMERVEGMLRAALDLDPSFPQAHAALGNVLIRSGRRAEAVKAYWFATMMDWAYADAHLALATLAEVDRDDATAALHRREALSHKVLYESRAPYAVRDVLVPTAPGGVLANAPLDFCIDSNRTNLHVYFLTENAPAPLVLPKYDVIFNAVDESEAFAETIDRCIDFVATQDKPVINHPARLKGVRRSELHKTLRNVAGCTVPKTERLTREAVQRAVENPKKLIGIDFPLLIRPVDTHRGDGLEILRSAYDLNDFLERFRQDHFNLSQFVDYRNPDGHYRKYRVILVAGRPFPYHLAISKHWMVNYANSLMRENAWMRDEEKRFMSDPGSVFPGWDTTFKGIAEAIGLDYFGIDCSVLPDGSVLVFESGPAMIVHCRDPFDVFAYKYDYVPRIFDAVDNLLDERSRSGATAASR